MKFPLVAACLVAGIAFSSCFVHSMPKQRYVDQNIEEITESPVTTRNPSNPCEEYGIYNIPSAGDCAEYTQCIYGDAYPARCASGLLFDPSIGKCNKEELVICYEAPTTPAITTPAPVTTTEEPPTTEAPICEPEGIYNVPFSLSCSLYILCVKGIPVIQECAQDLSFDPIELTCVREEVSTCVMEGQCQGTTTVEPSSVEPSTPASVTTDAPATTPGNEFTCPEDGVGYNFYPHHTSCRLFYACRGPQFDRIFDCGEGYWFDSASQACIYPKDSDCKLEPLP